jgi:hypothetical protein
MASLTGLLQQAAAGAAWHGGAPVDWRNGGRAHGANHCDDLYAMDALIGNDDLY